MGCNQISELLKLLVKVYQSLSLVYMLDLRMGYRSGSAPVIATYRDVATESENFIGTKWLCTPELYFWPHQ
jgi:hypothetical protein